MEERPAHGAVARLALPTDDTAIVSVELALKARYSSAEATLSIQAQLTDNSYIFDKDCQLTGGFAYFMWFPEGQFVLTIGGYNPHFQKPTQFPDVPRLGFAAAIQGRDVRDLARECLALARDGLRRRARRDQNGYDETRYLAPLEHFVDRGITPAEELLEKFHGAWEGSVEPLFTSYVY